VQAGRRQFAVAPLGVAEMGVAAVDDDVAFFQQGTKLRDLLVDGRPRLDHQDDGARPLDRRRDEVLSRDCERITGLPFARVGNR
jgi:hypothetical protein